MIPCNASLQFPHEGVLLDQAGKIPDNMRDTMSATPIFIATWRFGVTACRLGWERLAEGASALDAIELGANAVELDPLVGSVGYGGLPNADGVVELDAAIMDGLEHRAGAVAGLTGIRRPISVARRVMEHTPHVMLVGANALRFALSEGFVEEDLLTETTRDRWQQWSAEQTRAEVAHFEEPKEEPDPQVSPASEAQSEEVTEQPLPFTEEDHDTIGLCALDANGNLAAGCTTSGLAWKRPGRVGDSPIIGAGLYVDNEIGAAAATGHGDEMMKACLSYRVVLKMGEGLTPQQACEEALLYLLRKRPSEQHQDYGAALIALRKDGQIGAAATRSGFHSPDRLWQWAAATPSGIALHEGVYVLPSGTILPSLL